MSKKAFNPYEWLNGKKSKKPNKKVTTNNSTIELEIDALVSAVESAAVDIAPTYTDWRNLGFALTDALGEGGRSYYHRLSRFYPSYDEAETDKQFNACLNANGSGITKNTLFLLAQRANVNSPKTAKSPKSLTPALTESEEVDDLLQSILNEEYDENTVGVWDIEDIGNIEDFPQSPTFSQKVKDTLPDFLQQVVSKSESKADADVLLLSAMVVMSSCMNNIFGVYHHNTVSPNLYLFVSAPASAGKSRLKLSKRLVQPIHDDLRKESKLKLEEYNHSLASSSESVHTTPPPIKTLIIPADSSSTSVYQLLNDNDGIGLIFDTEGDTLANKFKSEYGDFSEGLRKGFHNETISYSRRKDNEFVEIISPFLSVVLSGTPQQVVSLIPSEENGLFSRFIFYSMNQDVRWKNVFPEEEITHENYFDMLGNTFKEFYCNFLGKDTRIEICLTRAQKYKFNKFFAKLTLMYFYNLGIDFVATTHRLGLIAYRLIMIFTILRIMETGEVSKQLYCNPDDYVNALTIVSVLVQHSAKMFNMLPSSGHSSTPEEGTLDKQNFLRNLPREFDRKKYLTIAEELGIPAKTAEKHINGFCKNGKLNHLAHGKYGKP